MHWHSNIQSDNHGHGQAAFPCSETARTFYEEECEICFSDNLVYYECLITAVRRSRSIIASPKLQRRTRIKGTRVSLLFFSSFIELTRLDGGHLSFFLQSFFSEPT